MVCGIYVGGCTPKLFLVRATMKAVKNTVEGVKFTYCKITTKIRWQLHEGFENPCSLGEDLIMTSIPRRRLLRKWHDRLRRAVLGGWVL